MDSISVFVWKTEQGQVGNDVYPMAACFIGEGVHVPFEIETHSENEYLKTVGEPAPCDGSCREIFGHLADFATKRHHSSYEVKRIVDAAKSFCPSPRM